MLGGKAVLIGSIGRDGTGKSYRRETERSGVQTRFSDHDALSGHAITFITPDGERTFATHLGAALSLCADDIQEGSVSDAKILHIEGYLLEAGPQREAAVCAMEYAKKHGVKISIDLADPGVVQRNEDAVRTIARDYADILFLNEQEAEAFTGKKEKEALAEVRSFCDIAVVKIGSRGSLVSCGDSVYEIPSYPVTLVNTNGAGDNYAAGMLWGICRGYDVEQSAKIGSFAAAKVVAVAGARLEKKFTPDDIAFVR
ncbi:MAG: carbohydrate kinase family protein [Spirochaetota bacterium]